MKEDLLTHTEIEFIEDEKKNYLNATVAKPNSRGQTIVDHLRGKATVKITSEEIIDLTRGDD